VTVGTGFRAQGHLAAGLAVMIVLLPALSASGETQPQRPAPVEMLFVRPVAAIEAGRNDANPAWSRSGLFLTFERSAGEKKEIRVQLGDGSEVQTVSHQRSAERGGLPFLFPGVVEDISYNAGLSWSPDENRFVFMSNGGAGNYDLYLGELGDPDAARLTEHREKDGQPDWSPRANAVVFVSGRTGKGDLYLLDMTTRGLTRLTAGGREHLYPQWSPDGRRLAFMSGSSENHDIVVMEHPVRPEKRTSRRLTTWACDDIRPVWSPDGTRIAFYANYDPAGDPKAWSIMVIAADGSDPAEGEGLAAKAVAVDVVPDVERGPAWMPDSGSIVYVKNDRQDYHPLYIVDLPSRTSRPLRTGTKMNHDVVCGPDGTIAFRAQVDQWDRVFVAKMKE
jgi:TolB protein